MFTKDRLLRLAMISEDLFDYSLTTALIPSPDKIVWLNSPSEKDIFPDYVLSNLIHLGHLEAFGFSAPWELQRFLLGVEGAIRYEVDLKKLCGDIFYHAVNASNKQGLGEKLCQNVEKLLPSQRIVGATFRNEVVEGKDFLILSRAVLQPRKGLFGVELKFSRPEDYQRRLTEVYKIITRGAPK